MTWLSWDKGQARLARVGAMLTDLEFRLPDGRSVAPLHKAHWLAKELPVDVPPLLAGLQGEWPCVPFGFAPEGSLAGDWAVSSRSPDPWPHGFAANHAWQVSSAAPDEVQAEIVYPETDPVRRLTRSVRGVTGEAAVEIGLEIHMRREARLPIGIHPVFRLPAGVGQARLRPGVYERGYCHPGETGGSPAFSTPESFRFDALPEMGFDPLSLPYETPSETLLLLSGTDGHFELENLADQYRVALDWNARAFPSVMLWISNGGRLAAPWSGRHWALGVEPVCSAFDLGVAISGETNPLSREGIKTAQALRPDRVFETRYRISVAAL